jgi:hypothetical protein
VRHRTVLGLDVHLLADFFIRPNAVLASLPVRLIHPQRIHEGGFVGRRQTFGLAGQHVAVGVNRAFDVFAGHQLA